MRSARPDRETGRPRKQAPSLARRVAAAGAAAAILGGVVAAVVAGLATEGLLAARDDDRLRDAASELLAETIEEAEETGGGADAWEEALRDELEDVEVAGARAAVHRGDVRLAGDPAIFPQPSDACSLASFGAGDFRLCSVQRGEVKITLAARAVDPASQRRLLAWAALVGLLVGAVAGGGASAFVARWAVAPLRLLRDRVRDVSPDAPRPELVAEPLAYAEVEELRIALRELLERSSASLAQAQRFAMDAAHELRTPLTTLSGELELLAEQRSGNERRDLEPLRSEVDRLMGLVARLLTLATPAATLDAAVEVVDLGDLVRDVVSSSPPQERERIALSDAGDVLVRGDTTLLRIALQNGIDNALKFSRGAVTVRLACNGNDAVVDVIDEGPGIAVEDAARVFEPFYRAAGARAATAGHGIGLALVAHIVRGLHGEVELVPAPRGTCLRLRFPRLRATPLGNRPQA